MPDSVDVLVAGGGPVGAALAAALRESGLATVLAEPHAAGDARDSGPEASVRPPDRPPRRLPFRPIALSHVSAARLARIGALGALALTPIRSIHVSQAGGFGRTLIAAQDLGVSALGWVTDLAPLADALQRAARRERIAARVERWAPDDGGVRVWLDGAPAIRARLLVLADGGKTAGEDLSMRDYGQAALVAPVRTELPQDGVAWERFTGDGPLALLPYADRYALVWTVRAARAPALLDSTAAAFLAELGRSFGRRLGEFTEVGARVSFPLALRFRRAAAVAPRVVAIGNAAQTLHPVAGQGLNLGLRDAFELAELVGSAGGRALARGDVAAAFAAQRRADRYASIGITDGLVRVFGLDHPLAAAARGAGLAALDLIPPARRFLARRFVYGLRAVP